MCKIYEIFQEFRPLCKISRHKVELRDTYGGEEYEYRPPYYYESICQGPNQNHPSAHPQHVINPNVVKPLLHLSSIILIQL